MKRKLQVFISSTFTDLIEERQAAVGAILKAGHIPAGMELFTAGDRSQMDTIEEWIDESDVYMLILGGRYGSIEKSSGISYTELEYDYAVQQEKPVFAVVLNDAALKTKVKNFGVDFMERENPKELALFRTKVLNNISSFFDDSKDIKLCVYESLANFSSKRDLKGWVSGADIVDTKPLFDEIKKLSDENKLLKEALENTEKRVVIAPVKSNPKTESFEELSRVLTAIEVKIPASLTGGEEKTVDLLNIFVTGKDSLISGITNQSGASEAERFFYYNVFPKLQIHGLSVNEKVAGVRYRRSCVSPLGHEFLGYMERQTVLKKSEAN